AHCSISFRDLNLPPNWDRATGTSPNGLLTGVDRNGNGIIDGSDVIRAFENLVDDDGNGVTDDLVGADFTTIVDPDGNIVPRLAGHDTGDVDPIYGHGTGSCGLAGAVASTIQEQAFGLAGGNWAVRILPIKIPDPSRSVAVR